MAQPVTAAHVRRIELPLREVRSRLSQLVRMAGVTGQITVVVDDGRALAEIRPITPPPPDRPAGPDLRAIPRPTVTDTRPDISSRPDRTPAASGSRAPLAAPEPAQPPEPVHLPEPARPPQPAQPTEPAQAAGASAAGWLRRLDKVRDDLKHQHAVREAELLHALDDAWRLLDDARPPGSDRATDVLRGAHRPFRQPPAK